MKLNIEKLLQICDDYKEVIVGELLAKVRELQKNSDKKQFAYEPHKPVNHQINSRIKNVEFPIIHGITHGLISL